MINTDKALRDFATLTGITYDEIDARFFDLCDFFHSEYPHIITDFWVYVVSYSEKELKLALNATIKIDNGKYVRDVCDYYFLTTKRDYLGYLDYYVE